MTWKLNGIRNRSPMRSELATATARLTTQMPRCTVERWKFHHHDRPLVLASRTHAVSVYSQPTTLPSTQIGAGAIGPSSAVQQPTTSITALTRTTAKPSAGPARRGRQPNGQANDGATASTRVRPPTTATTQRVGPTTAALPAGSPALTSSTVTTAATHAISAATTASSATVYELSRSRQPAAPVNNATRRSLSSRPGASPIRAT
jgi:hypothetical protein